MDAHQIFSDEEYGRRTRKVIGLMVEKGLDGLIVTTPENIYYLSGLDYQGYFVPHFLIVTANQQQVLITRAMESKTIDVQVKHAKFIGYEDGADIADTVCAVIRECGLGSAKIAMERQGLFLPPALAEKIISDFSGVKWSEGSGIVDEVRRCQSSEEIAYTEKAAEISVKMMETAISTAAEGVGENEIAAEVYRAMLESGGDQPGFVPLIRSTPTLEQEHTAWSKRKLAAGDPLFLEMAGCLKRYHAPMGRFFYIGKAPAGTKEVADVNVEANRRVVDAIRAGAVVKHIYKIWQDTLNDAGLVHYRRLHCGYITGIGFPPSWVGGAMVVGLRHDSDFILKEGMVLHIMSWMLGTGTGSYFMSNTGVVRSDGCDVLTDVPWLIEKAD